MPAQLKITLLLVCNQPLWIKRLIEEYAFIAAGSLVTPGKIVKSRELWAGSPAKFIRKIMEEEVRFMQDNIENYIDLAKEYK